MNSQQIIKQHLMNLDTIESSGKCIYIGRKLVKRCLKYIETKRESMLTKLLVTPLLIYAITAGNLTSNGRRMWSIMVHTLGILKKCPALEHDLREMDSTQEIVNITSDITLWVKLTYKLVLGQRNSVKSGPYSRSILTSIRSNVTMDPGAFYAPYIPTLGPTKTITSNKSNVQSLVTITVVDKSINNIMKWLKNLYY